MNHPENTCNYKLNLPYPPIQVDGPNLAYANEMLSDMADNVSEISDVARYFYIAVMTRELYPDISTCFRHISIVEMHHLNMFAELALKLGADPRLWCGSPYKQWWSPSYLGYSFDLRVMIMESIKAEEAAICKYSSQAGSIQDMNIVAVLKRIILDEEQHLRIFREMYQNLG